MKYSFATLLGAMSATVALAAPSHPSHGHASTLRSRQFNRAHNGGNGGGSPGFGGQGASSSSIASSKPTATATASSSPSTATTVAIANTDSSSSTSSSASSSSFSSLPVMSNDQWAGAGYSGLYSSGEVLHGVSTSFNVLSAAIPTDADTGESMYYASAWIGIDGQGTCADENAGLWQAGVDSTVTSDGTVGFYAWYEWYPAGTVVVDIGTISAGDIIFMNLTALSTGSTGTIVIENTTTGKSVTETVSSENTLCLDTVEWIMEDVTFGDSSEGLADFATLTFADSVFVTDKKTYTAADSNEHYEITDRTSTTVSGETVVVKYV